MSDAGLRIKTFEHLLEVIDPVCAEEAALQAQLHDVSGHQFSEP